MIAKAETEYYQDIKIFAEKINYRCADECCANCRFARPLEDHNRIFHEHHTHHDAIWHNCHKHPRHQLHDKYACMNRELFVTSEANGDLFNDTRFSIEPEVDGHCVCDMFVHRDADEEPFSHIKHEYDENGDPLPRHQDFNPKGHF